MSIMKEMDNYFEKEYQDTKAILEEKPSWVKSEEEVVNNAIQRCLGVSMFAQHCGVTYQEALVYEYYKEKLESLLK